MHERFGELLRIASLLEEVAWSAPVQKSVNEALSQCGLRITITTYASDLLKVKLQWVVENLSNHEKLSDNYCLIMSSPVWNEFRLKCNCLTRSLQLLADLMNLRSRNSASNFSLPIAAYPHWWGMLCHATIKGIGTVIWQS